VISTREVIQLPQQRLAELFQHPGEAQPPPGLGVLVGRLRDLRQDLQVLEHPRLDPRPLDLHRHPAPVAQHRAMDLAERGRGHGGLLERRLAFVHGVGQAGVLDEVRAPVLHEEERDVLVARQVAGLHGQSHAIFSDWPDWANGVPRERHSILTPTALDAPGGGRDTAGATWTLVSPCLRRTS
jgi:hypothetical protein